MLLRLLLGAGTCAGLLLARAGEQPGHPIASSCTMLWGAIRQVQLPLLLLLLLKFW
jgi:hypothetical protein